MSIQSYWQSLLFMTLNNLQLENLEIIILQSLSPLSKYYKIYLQSSLFELGYKVFPVYES